MQVMTERSIKETMIIAIITGHLQYAAFMQLLQLEKEDLILSASPATPAAALACRGRRLAAIMSPTLLLILPCIAASI